MKTAAVDIAALLRRVAPPTVDVDAILANPTPEPYIAADLGPIRTIRRAARIALDDEAMRLGGVDARLIREGWCLSMIAADDAGRAKASIESRTSVVIAGATGTTKSAIAAAMIRAVLCEEAARVSAVELLAGDDADGEPSAGFHVVARWEFVPTLMDKLRMASRGDAGAIGERIEELSDVAWLVLDDICSERSTPFAEECLFRIIHQRQAADKPMIVTSNLSLEEMSSKMPEQGGRIASRLNGACNVIKRDGQDRRNG